MQVTCLLIPLDSNVHPQLHKNQLKRLPESFTDLIFLTYIDLSYVAPPSETSTEMVS